ncbi:MAG TPA: polysaccharide deacetylase family protein [Candidatus Acidoferrales bacterium]
MAGVSRLRKWVITVVGLAAGVLALLVWVPLWVVDALAAAFPAVVWKAETREAEVAITFDDGPHPVYTPQVLDILKRHNARATFFVVGRNVRRYPELVERIRAEGHEIANHTDSRRTTVRMDTASFVRSLEAAEATLEAAQASDTPSDNGSPPNGSPPNTTTPNTSAPRIKLMRPAGGLIKPEQLAAARERGYTVVLGSAYGWDGRRAPPAAYMRWVISKNLRRGAIVVLHDSGGGGDRTIAALDGILAAGSRRGLKWVTLTELLDSNQP